MAFNKNGLDDTPNTTRVNLRVTISAGVVLISFTHRKRKTSLSVFETDINKKATVTVVIGLSSFTIAIMNQLSGQIMCANRYVLPPTVLKVIGLYELNHFHTNLNMYIINPKSGILETSKILGSKGTLIIYW